MRRAPTILLLLSWYEVPLKLVHTLSLKRKEEKLLHRLFLRAGDLSAIFSLLYFLFYQTHDFFPPFYSVKAVS